MFAISRWLSSAVMIALLAACGNSSNNANDDDAPVVPAATGTIEVIHASADAPAVNVVSDTTEVISGLDYKQAEFLSVPVGDVPVRVDGILPGENNTITVIPTAGDDPVVPVSDGGRVSVVAIGNLANIMPRVLIDDDPVVPAGEVRVRVLHAAPDVIAAGDSAVQVWLTNPGADLVNPAGTDTVITAVFEFDQLLTADPLQVPADDYQIRVTLPGDPTAVAYDSGVVALPPEANLVVVAVPNTGPGDAPISLLASTGAALLEFQDVDTPSNVRVVHAASDAPPVDVLVNGNPGIANLEFGKAAGPVPLEPGLTTFDVVASPAMAGSMPVISASPSLVQGGSATVFAVGTLTADPDNPIDGLLLPDVTRQVATEARVRIVHASVIAENVDIYVQPGNRLPPAGDIPGGIDPTFGNVPFKADTGYVPLNGDTYDVAVTKAGSRTPAIGPLTVNFDDGGIYTVVALDGPNLTIPLSVLALDDTL
jgi:hypothetical protein